VWRGELPLRARRFIRFALGSAVATATSAGTIYVVFHLLGAPAGVASVCAFASGFVVNFVAGRYWAWNRRGPAGLGRDAVSYLAVAIGTALAAFVVTTLTDHYARRSASLNTHLTVVIEGAYFATYAAMFLIKFSVLDRVVFRGEQGPVGSTAGSGPVRRTTRV